MQGEAISFTMASVNTVGSPAPGLCNFPVGQLYRVLLGMPYFRAVGTGPAMAGPLFVHLMNNY